MPLHELLNYSNYLSVFCANIFVSNYSTNFVWILFLLKRTLNFISWKQELKWNYSVEKRNFKAWKTFYGKWAVILILILQAWKKIYQSTSMIYAIVWNRFCNRLWRFDNEIRFFIINYQYLSTIVYPINTSHFRIHSNFQMELTVNLSVVNFLYIVKFIYISINNWSHHFVLLRNI